MLIHTEIRRFLDVSLQCVALMESLECGLAATLESAVVAPMLQSPSPACADLLYLSYRCFSPR